jgi:hypothetical protein
MKHRAALWRRLAVEHPWNYWLTQSAAIYGLMSLLTDVEIALGWAADGRWNGRLIVALAGGAVLLWLMRRARGFDPAV